jgi:hypothetical protein
VWAPGVEVVPAKESGKLEISIPKDLAADRVWLRLYNAEGASTAAPFLIGNLKEVSEQEPNDSPRKAQALGDPNLVVNGILAKAGDVDCFAVRLSAGQTLVAAVDANARLGAPMDAILQVATTDGTVLAENNDDLQLDPRLAFTPAKTGTFIVRLFAFPSEPGTAIQFSGAANYIYRLTLTTGPFITHAVPLSASRANPGAVEVFGWNIPARTKLAVVPFGGKFADQLEREAPNDLRVPPDSRLGFVFGANFAGAARVRLTSQPVISAVEPADPKNLPVLTPSTSVTGWLRNKKQTDVFRVPLKKGQPIVVAVESNTLDLPLDPVVKLADPDGAIVADVDDTGPTRDAAFTIVAAKDGDYRLSVGDRYRQGGERCFYRLTVRLEEPDFELSTSADSIVVTPGKPVDLPVKVQRWTPRAGAVGPITIQVLGLPPGVTAAPVISEPAGPTAAAVTLKLSANGPAFSGPIRIAGKATQPRTIERLARTPPRLGAAFETIWLTVVEKK